MKGIFNMLLLLFEVTIMQIVCRDSRTLSDDYEKVMPDFAKYFKYGLFRYSKIIKEVANG